MVNTRAPRHFFAMASAKEPRLATAFAKPRHLVHYSTSLNKQYSIVSCALSSFSS